MLGDTWQAMCHKACKGKCMCDTWFVYIHANGHAYKWDVFIEGGGSKKGKTKGRKREKRKEEKKERKERKERKRKRKRERGRRPTVYSSGH